MRIVRIDKKDGSVSVLGWEEATGQLHGQFDVETAEGLLKRLQKGKVVDTFAATYQSELTYAATRRQEETEERSLFGKLKRLLATAFEK